VSVFFRSREPVEDRSVGFGDVFGAGGDVDVLGGGLGALCLVPLFAAHRTIIDAVASTPVHAYRARPDGTAERLRIQPAVLTRPPWGTPFTWRAQAVASLVSDGNAFGVILGVDRAGWPSSLMWVDPARIVVDDSGALPEYYFEGRHVERDAIVHIPWILPCGKMRGLSPLRAFRTAYEMGQSAQEAARDWFVNRAVPGGHLKSDRPLRPGQAEQAKTRFKAAIRGRDVFVSGSDWSYQALSVPADEARFIETLKLTATQIAAIYGIPPEEIGGERGSSLTYATLEADELRFAARVVQPWAVRLEEALTAIMPRPQYVKFNLNANVRADLMTRMQAHEIALRAGVETAAEARRLEDRPPLSKAERAEWLALWRPGQQTPTTNRSGT
jgi:HK97 family phage portal protein